MNVNIIIKILWFTAIVPKSLDGLERSKWVKGRSSASKIGLISWLIDGCEVPYASDCSINDHILAPEYQSFDGFSNNIFQTQLGAVDTPLLRRVSPVYNDGTYEPVKRNRINPLTASQMLMTRKPECNSQGVESGLEACGSKTGKTAFLVFFGQQVVEEILDAQRPGCPPEYFNIEIPKDHEYKMEKPGKSVLPFLRSRYSQLTGHSPGNPRQQLNEITPWIDGGLIYGTSKAWADVLRTFPNGTLHPHGKLASDDDKGLFPAKNTIRLPMANPPPPARHSDYIKEHETAKVNRFFVLGNPRGNENAFLLSFGVVLFRWHNHIAEYLHKTRPSWSGEKVFNEARKWAIATYQQIVIYDWLPEWLGEGLEPYEGYNPSIDPQIEQFFQTAAMRFGHTLVTPGAYLRDFAENSCKTVPFHGLHPPSSAPTLKPSQGAVRTCNIYWRPQEPLLMPHNSSSINDENIADIDLLLMGMASQRAEREDNMIVEDLRGRVFGPLEFSRRDLMAINIQRGRDHGTPDYNSARAAFGLERINSVEDYINKTGTGTDESIVRIMEKIHTIEGSASSPWDNIDVWTGGILETTTGPGQLFKAIIKDQFKRIRDGDRFWFENTKWSRERFSDDQIDRIKTLRVGDLILSVTKMLEEDIQPNPFIVPDSTWVNPSSKCSPLKNGPLIESTCLNISTNLNYPCWHLPQIDSPTQPVENCTEAGTYDYFTGSEIPFILTFTILGATIIAIVSSLKLAAFYANKNAKVNSETNPESNSPAANRRSSRISHIFQAREWISRKEDSRKVALTISYDESKLNIQSVYSSEMIKVMDLSKLDIITLVQTTDKKHVVIKNPKEYDIAFEFEAQFLRDDFVMSLKKLNGRSVVIEEENVVFEKIIEKLVTRNDRIKNVQQFFTYVFKTPSALPENPVWEEEALQKALDIELSKAEFADALGMPHNSSFLNNMFRSVDLDNNGYISFTEFFTLLKLIEDGNSGDKISFIFRMYSNGKEFLSGDSFKNMIYSIIETCTRDMEETESIAQQIIKNIGVRPIEHVTLDDFVEIFAPHEEVLERAAFNFVGIPVSKQNAQRVNMPNIASPFDRLSYIDPLEYLRRKQENVPLNPNNPQNYELVVNNEAPKDMTEAKSKITKHWIIHWFEIKRLKIFWASLYTLVVAAIFAERAYYYSVEREHGGLRHIAGFGVTVTRGAASVQMFTYATLLLTMCRNIITTLRETFLSKFIPFDQFIALHKYIAYIGLISTVIHVVGHGINFYHISTQTPEDLTCLFRDYYRPTHVLPKFQYWAFGTVTGLSGFLLIILCVVIYTFSTRFARMKTFKLFWITHSLYPLWYALILLHGSGRLVQSPLFLNFLLGPLFIFIFDKLITISRSYVEIPVLEAELLPSNVTKLKFARPKQFKFQSGQWIRIASSALNPGEFHPFTISSAPHESFLTVHIRAVGPFTTNIRRVYESCSKAINKPSIYLDGPYGEGHQDWHRYEVSILIGGGIGVTPFSSILKDIHHDSSLIPCKKVYFIWVTRTQKQFEWLVDIIKEVESHHKICVHVYITQSYDQYDLRTALLYACERNFRELNNKSLFTGLKSMTHFSRPDFYQFFKGVRSIHPDVKKVGVFSCGPIQMGRQVDSDCQQINSEQGTDEAEFEHKTVNF